jgi:hypothetical protein
MHDQNRQGRRPDRVTDSSQSIGRSSISEWNQPEEEFWIEAWLANVRFTSDDFSMVRHFRLLTQTSDSIKARLISTGCTHQNFFSCTRGYRMVAVFASTILYEGRSESVSGSRKFLLKLLTAILKSPPTTWSKHRDALDPKESVDVL